MGKNKKKNKKLSSRFTIHGSRFTVGDVRVWSVALLIAVVTFIIYIPALQNGFVNWDDDGYVYKNTNIRPIDLKFLKWSFTSFHSSNWHPVTWLSHAIDYAVWKLNPVGHHLSSIILHSINTFLLTVLAVYLILNSRLKESLSSITNDNIFTRAIIAGGVTALLFGIHPVHVESVAWVAERKDVLSTFFVLLSLIFYVRYIEGQEINMKSPYYILSLISFVLALMSKPMAITLPLILVIMDIYPFQRIALKGGIVSQKKVFIEKGPFFLFSGISAVLTFMAQQSGGAIKPFEMFPLSSRIVMALRGLFFYLEKMVFPVGLSPYYPYPKDISVLSLKYLIPILLVVFISVLCIWTWKRGKKIFFAVWLYYAVTLLPVLGIIQVGKQAAADRYTYIPSIGPFILAGIAIAVIAEKIKDKAGSSIRGKVIVFLPLILVFSLMGLMTTKQIKVWKDSVTLWSSVLEKSPDDAGSYFSRGNAYAVNGNYREALRDLDRAIGLMPDYSQAYLNRANVYELLGNIKEALKDLEKTIDLAPDYAEAYNNRGLIFKTNGDYQSALKDFSKALELQPEYVAVYNNRAGVYLIMKDYQKALKNLDKSIELEPEDAVTRINRCWVYYSLGDYPHAINDCSSVIEIDSRNAVAFKYRGLSYTALSRHKESSEDYTRAINLGQKDYETYYHRGNAYRSIGENQKAIYDFSRVIELNPSYLDAYINRGIAYGDLGKLEDSIADFSKIIQMNPGYAAAYYNRGAAFYRLGKKTEAIRDFQKAARLGDKEIQKVLKERGVRW